MSIKPFLCTEIKPQDLTTKITVTGELKKCRPSYTMPWLVLTSYSETYRPLVTREMTSGQGKKGQKNDSKQAG
jgi:hypothetical protein